MSTSSSSETKVEDFICIVCQQANCDVQIESCGCLLHTTCLPLDFLLANQPIRKLNTSFCPCSRPINRIRILPLPVDLLDDAAKLREDSTLSIIHKNVVTSMAKSIAIFNGTKKRTFASEKPSPIRSYRTGRWAAEESAYIDGLIKAYDAGLLPLPNGIKLNEFLCDLLSCRTSRLTKKLKGDKLSQRVYRSASGNTLPSLSGGSNVGQGIQEAQTSFLNSITQEWVRMELQFNISRMWRTHFANVCLQISYNDLNTKDWFASLDAAEYLHDATTCNDTKLGATKKRMRLALAEDANVAAQSITNNNTGSSNTSSNEGANIVDEGVFVSGMPFKRLSDLNLRSLADDAEKPANVTQRELVDSLGRKFSIDSEVFVQQSLKSSSSMSSFVDLFSTPEMKSTSKLEGPSNSFDLAIGAPSMDATEDHEELLEITSSNQQSAPEADATIAKQPAASEVDSIINEAIEYATSGSSSFEKDYRGMFLQKVRNFLEESASPFKHIDIWVPMDITHSNDIVGKQHIGGASSMASTSSDNVTGTIYGSQPVNSSVRLCNAGYITVQADEKTMKRFNEFGMYSKNFSFESGFGAVGRVFLSRAPLWENDLTSQSSHQFARLGGARIFGVNTAFFVPILTHIGIIVVALYSAENLTRDAAWEKKCVDNFSALKPSPRWELTIDIGLGSQAASSKRPVVHPSIIPLSPTTAEKSLLKQLHPSREVSVDLSFNDNKPIVKPEPSPEQSLALLIGKYMPLERDGYTTDSLAGSLVSLHLYLLRHSSDRASTGSNIVEMILSKYQTYLRDTNMKEHDLIVSIASDWKRMLSSVNAGFSNPLPIEETCRSSSLGSTVSTAASSFLSDSAQFSASQFGLEDNHVRELVTSGADTANTCISSSLTDTVNSSNVRRIVSDQGPIKQDTDNDGERS